MSDGAGCKELDGRLVLGNGYFSLDIFLGESVNPTNLRSKRTGRVYADSRYRYQHLVWERQTGINQYVTHSVRRRSRKGAAAGAEVLVVGRLGDLQVEQEFFVPDSEAYLEERVTVKNIGGKALSTPNISFGFAKALTDERGALLKELADSKMVAVPYRREPWYGLNGEYIEYSLQDLLSQEGWYRPWFKQEERAASEKFGSEGWAWTGGESSLLIAKHSLEGMEFALLETAEEDGRAVLQFGSGVWHGDPEAATRLEAGDEWCFGLTRYVFVEGGWKECYYAFREFMAEQGHGVPKDFDPPVHWNELYDNPFWWTTVAGGGHHDVLEDRERLYTLESMEVEARKAKELGCEALYLDPGWDTMFGSSIWASHRLLSARAFVQKIWNEYGLRVSLHTPLAGWTDSVGRNATYPQEAHKTDREGKSLVDLCMASRSYIATKRERLLDLAKAGATFFMFDGDAYKGPCYDPDHGHSVPLTREEHGRAILSLARSVHDEFPHVLIELHAFVGRCVCASMPTYYLHEPGGPDELWAFEYMWDPMQDIVSGRAASLYYYNLGYGYPLYLHIDLRKDNEHALEFWYYASTCRHLGVGGTHPDARVWEAHKKAMKAYRRLKRFYTQGTFYGLGESVIVHTLAEERKAVMNVFNLSSKPVEREIAFRPEEIGLHDRLKVGGAAYSQKTGEPVTLRLKLSEWGTALVEIEAVA